MQKYTEIQKQRLAEQLWNRERPVCQTHLVDMLMNEGPVKAAFSYDAVENMYPDPSKWGANQCRAYLDECSDRPLYWSDDEPEEWRQAVLDYADPAEIYEWWCVSDWFADKLREQGECILANDYGTWWGRQYSGQSVVLDPCIQRIAVDVLGYTVEGEG